ncbi:MAG: hypothetical protein JW892_00100 [Anaerolineae bacterium]|nr:hypothetical protein [Anaerolineae bacterium]
MLSLLQAKSLFEACRRHLRGLTVVLLLLVGMKALALASMFHVNFAMLDFRNMLVEQEPRVPDIYPFYGLFEGDSRIIHIADVLERAVVLSQGSFTASWSLGRVALASGSADRATEVLEKWTDRAQRNPLLYMDLLTSFDKIHAAANVVTVYESAPLPLVTRTISDTVALAYMDLNSIVGTEQKNYSVLKCAATLRPEDLYVNYHLWRLTQKSDDQTTAGYREALIHYPFEAVNPTDMRLLDYAMEVMPALRADGVWDRDQLSTLVSYLVWRHGSLLSVQDLLQELARLYPSEPEWPFYLGEAFHRHGDWARAEQAYLQALSIDPGYATAYLRLGLVSEARCKENDSACDTAAFEWYSQYHALAPNDVFALMKLTQLCEDTGCYELGLWREELRMHTDGRLFVANQLGVPVDTVRLGPDLVTNAGFEKWRDQNPEGWALGIYQGQNRNCGYYAAGEDDLIFGMGVARIIALWEHVVPEQARTYAEYIGTAHPYGDERYLISLRYASQDPDNMDLVFLGENTVVGGTRLAYAGVKDSNRQWFVKHILIDGASISTPLTPLIRNWGRGQLWIDALEIRPVILGEDSDRQKMLPGRGR